MQGEPLQTQRGDLRAIAVRFALGALMLLGVVFVASRVVGAALEPYAAAFVARYGYPGMALGAFVSDATTFPVAPQFYMLTAISAGAPWHIALAAISLGSILGGATGMALAGRAARLPSIGRRIERSRAWVDRLVSRYGAWGMVVASMSPVPFSILCYLTGLYRLGARATFIVLAMRVPRLALFFALIALGWRR